MIWIKTRLRWKTNLSYFKKEGIAFVYFLLTTCDNSCDKTLVTNSLKISDVFWGMYDIASSLWIISPQFSIEPRKSGTPITSWKGKRIRYVPGIDKPYPYLAQLWNFESSMLFNFVLVWLYKYFDISVTDESYVDETLVWHT